MGPQASKPDAPTLVNDPPTIRTLWVIAIAGNATFGTLRRAEAGRAAGTSQGDLPA